jgi:hypothetical protein
MTLIASILFFLITFAPVGIAVAMICDMER